MDKKYKLIYLPFAKQDIEDIFTYIASELYDHNAAVALLGKFDKSIRRLSEFPFSCPEYKVKGIEEAGYRMLVVENYLLFYVVLENTVEIRRVIYAKRDISNQL